MKVSNGQKFPIGCFQIDMSPEKDRKFGKSLFSTLNNTLSTFFTSRNLADSNEPSGPSSIMKPSVEVKTLDRKNLMLQNNRIPSSRQARN